MPKPLFQTREELAVYVQKHPGITARVAGAAIGLSEPDARDWLGDLLSRGRLKLMNQTGIERFYSADNKEPRLSHD